MSEDDASCGPRLHESCGEIAILEHSPTPTDHREDSGWLVHGLFAAGIRSAGLRSDVEQALAKTDVA
jgi:hypothetical protein